MPTPHDALVSRPGQASAQALVIEKAAQLLNHLGVSAGQNWEV